MLSDTASLGCVALGNRLGSSALQIVGTIGFFLVPPGLHAEHGDVGKLFGSLGARVLLPAIGYGILEAYGEPDLGIAIGALTAAVLDAALIAWEPVRDRD